jgi:hypothetical protein
MVDDKYEKYVGRQRTEKLNKELLFKSSEILANGGGDKGSPDDYESFEDEEGKQQQPLTIQKRNSIIIKAAIEQN